MIGRKGCPDCAGAGATPNVFGDYTPCETCCAAVVDGLIGRWMTVEASRLYARLAHPAGKGRRQP